MQNNNDPLVLTPLEAARLLRCGKGTIYEQIRIGTVPSIRMGRKILVPRAALMRMLEETGRNSYLASDKKTTPVE